MITKLRADIWLYALCLFVVSCFALFCFMGSEKIDALYFSFMLYGIIRFLKVDK